VGVGEGGERKTEFIKTKNCAQIEGNIEISSSANSAFSNFRAKMGKCNFIFGVKAFSLFKHIFILRFFVLVL
jgi:hypothetical protein